ncbi:hypothetical protein NQD34_007321 [Periophthalmus magnuspinnatus]|nr:hypothetical protein NQD34_007321 [Periophthalmus magnuspinnatus]
MGGLGNGRRGGRSPPLLIAALIACILVLGFNYWVSSSRNLELQTKLYELEGQVRRGAAERGVAEMKKTEFQEEIQRQREQISHIENLYKKQLEGAQSTCSQERVVLQQNISSSTKTIQELKGQLNQLNDDVGQLQKELQSCQGSIKTLNNKLTYDMTHCNSQVLSQKELCDERVAATKLEAQKKMEKLIASLQANTPDVEVKVSNETTKTVDYIVNPSQPRDQPSELLSNSILETKDVTATNTSDQGLLKQDPLAIPTAAAVKKDLLPPPEGAEATKPLETNTTDDKEMELMDTKDESHTDDPGMEDMLLTDDKADDPAHKVDLQDEYDTDDQEVVPEKQKASKH